MTKIEIINQPARFVYATGSNGRKNTIAYVYNDTQGCIYYGIAQCSERDRFVKEHGRNAAFGRLVASGGSVIPYSAIGGTKYAQVAGYISANIDIIASANFGLWVKTPKKVSKGL